MEQKMKEDSWILVRKDGTCQPLTHGMLFIGREECDIILQSSSADKRHAVICYEPSDRRISIKDLNSLTGTYVNDIRIPEQSYIKLNHLDLIRFGYGADVFHVKKADTSSFLPSPTNVTPEKLVAPPNTNKPVTLKENPVSIKVNSMPANKIAKQVPPEKTDLSTSLHEADSLEDLAQIDMPQHTHKCNTSSDNMNHPQHHSPSKYKDQFVRNIENESTKANSVTTCQPAIETSMMAVKDTTEKISNSFQQKNESQEMTLGKENPNTKAVIQQNCKNTMASSTGVTADSENNPSNSPLAMAFTIAFDNNTPRKKLSIKDSICRFAPRRPDSERPVQRQKVGKTSEPITKKVLHSVPENRNSIHTEIEKRNPQERTIEDLEDGWNMVNQKNDEGSEGKLSEGASYLIRKMFNGDSKAPPTNNRLSNHRLPSVPPVKSSSHINGVQKDKLPATKGGKDEKRISDKEETNVEVNDDKSETGTYTVEGDNVDPAVEEARQKIDEVFGVLLPAGSGAATYPPVVLREKEVSNTRGGSPIHRSSAVRHQGNDTSDSDNSIIRNRGDKCAMARPKRRLPTPPLQTSVSNASEGLLNGGRAQLSHYGTYTKNKSSFSKRDHLQLKEISPTEEEYKPYQCKGQVTTSVDRMSSSLPLNAVYLNSFSTKSEQDGLITQHSPSDTRSEGSPQSQTSPTGTLWRRMPWNSSGSDLELDQSKSETASVLSDISTSTEPSSPSCLSGRNRSDSGPHMKFNRAFALRRARLGLDTEVSPPPGRSSGVKDVQLRNLKSGTQLGPPASSLSRQDGGRFSLRLPQSSKRSSVGKSVTKTRNDASLLSSGTSGIKVGHRRMDSDPGKTAFWKKADGNTTSVSDSEKSHAITPSFKRSSSFCGADELESDKAIPSRSPLPNSANRPQQLGKHAIYKGRSNNPTLSLSQKGQTSKAVEAKQLASRIGNTTAASATSTTPSTAIDPVPNSTNTSTEASSKQNKSLHQQNSKQLSALDSLVISAIHQLSLKLRTGARCLLEKEREKYPENSDSRLMIEEVLPQLVEKKMSDNHGEVSLTRDLSSILKNLKRVEQSLEVLSSLIYSSSPTDKETSPSGPQNFFIVDV